MLDDATFNTSQFDAAPAATIDPTSLSSASRMVGFRLEIDRGAGSLETVAGDALEPAISISDSLDGFGAAEMTLSLLDAPSPIYLAWLRSLRRARLTLRRGTPGAIRAQVLFDGKTRESQFQQYPPVGAVTCQEAIEYASKRLFYSLAAFAGKTRAAVLAEIFAEAGIPAGTIDCPGTVYKAIQEGGDRSVLEFIAAFVEPAGRMAYWRDGQLYVTPTALGAPVRTLQVGDFRSIRIIPPSPTAANVVHQTAMVYGWTGTPGTWQKVVTESNAGEVTYTPAKAVRKQDHTTGVISAVNPSVSVQTETSKTVTTMDFDGGTMTQQVVEVYTWYAPKACARIQDGASLAYPNTPTDRYNDQFSVWEYGTSGSGDWRDREAEQFIVTSKTTTVRTFTSNKLTSYYTDVTTYRACFERFGRGTLTSFTNGTTFTVAWTDDVYIGSDGNAWVAGKELGPGESDPTVDPTVRLNVTYGFASDGTVNLVSHTVNDYSTENGVVCVDGTGAPTGNSQSLYNATSWGATKFGTEQAASYQIGPSYWSIAYAVRDDMSHTETTTVTGYTNAGRPSLRQNTTFTIPVAGTVVVTGTPPFPEYTTSVQVPQPIAADVVDVPLQALNGENVAYLSNDFAETSDENTQCGKEHLRRLCSPLVVIEMDVDGICRKGLTLRVPAIPGLTNETTDLLIRDVSTTMNQASGENTQMLVCRYYPPELR